MHNCQKHKQINETQEPRADKDKYDFEFLKNGCLPLIIAAFSKSILYAFWKLASLLWQQHRHSLGLLGPAGCSSSVLAGFLFPFCP